MRWSTEESVLLVVVIAFVLSVLIARRTRNRATRFVAILFLIPLGSLLALGCSLYVDVFVWPPIELSLARRGWLEDRRFDAELWRRGTAGQTVERSRADMVDHLLASHDELVGMTRAELEALLGKPEFDPDRMPGDFDSNLPCCAYWVDEPWAGLFYGSVRMSVQFDGEGRVASPAVVWTQGD